MLLSGKKDFGEKIDSEEKEEMPERKEEGKEEENERLEKNELNKLQKDELDNYNLNYLILDLMNEIKGLKTTINKQKNQINELINKTNNQSDIINSQKIEINKLKDNLNSQKNEINELKEHTNSWINYKNYLNTIGGSLILKNNTENIRLIKNWINPNKNIKSELLYRLTRDGDSFYKFHELCDNKGPTLTLFYTQEGISGGIYTPLSWDGYSSWKNDLETFIFNLDKKEKYKKLIEEKSIDCNYAYGPWVPHFGFDRYSMKTIRRTYNDINNYFKNGISILESKDYNNLEVEVYKIIIE